MKKSPFACWFIAVSLMCTLTIACSHGPDARFVSLSPHDQGPALIELEAAGTILGGIRIPAGDETFHLIAELENTSDHRETYALLAYYRNESYKHPERLHLPDGHYQYNYEASNNFYGKIPMGSDSLVTLEAGEHHSLSIEWFVQGNPRNEERYFGAPQYNAMITEEEIESIIAQMESNADWYSGELEKAENNGHSVEKQMRIDAIWTLDQVRKKGNNNNRWQRNPRMGNYSVLIAAVPVESLDTLPGYIINPELRDTACDCFVDPYYYWLHVIDTTSILVAQQDAFQARLQFSQNPGIYVNPAWIDKLHLDTSNFSVEAGFNDSLYQWAPFEEFFVPDKEYVQPQNVATVADVTGGDFHSEDYEECLKMLERGETVPRMLGYSSSAGKFVGVDHERSALWFENPGSESAEKGFKQNVGIQSRVGLTYGKYRALIQFPDQLSEEGFWNGLTEAFWLIYQDDGTWNLRSTCEGGYIHPHLPNGEVVRQATTNYSEIDIEIIKTSRYWPATSYPNSTQPGVDDGVNNNLIVSCTNWDLACPEPSSFHWGASPIAYGDTTYTTHRWDETYKALTSKYEYPHDMTVGHPIYYEIDWQPDHIIWRIGNTPEEMVVVGYMDTTITMIPDNQMVPVITQEFHDATWWPTAPYNQNAVPFPALPLRGYLLELTVE